MRMAPFFFFLVGAAAVAVLGEASAAAPVVNTSQTTPKESGGRVHVSSLSGAVVMQEAAVKVGEEVTVALNSPAGTNYQWVYLGMQRQRDAVPLDTSEGEGGKKKGAVVVLKKSGNSNDDKQTGEHTTTDDEEDEEDEEDDEDEGVEKKENDGDEQRASSLRGATEKGMMPGGRVTTTFHLPAMKEAGKYYHFFAFWSNGGDPTFRVVAVHVS